MKYEKPVVIVINKKDIQVPDKSTINCVCFSGKSTHT